MKNIKNFAKGILSCALMLITSNVMAENQYPEGSPVAINGKLKVENGTMVNECGYPTQLRGMSTHGLAWNQNTYNESSIKALVEDWHVSIFRIAVYTHEWGGYCKTQEDNPSQFWKTKDEYHELIDNLVDICGKYGIYCLIDWHVLNEGSGNPLTTLEDAKIFWDYMSKKHAGEDHVIYEICNEPNGSSGSWANIKKYADTIIPLIRENDPNTIVVCGTPSWSQNVNEAANSPLSEEYGNVMYTLHFYSGTHKLALRKVGDAAIKKGLALFVTEFGTTNSDGNGTVNTTETDNWMNWMDKNNISWCNWSFSDKSESSAALKSGSANSQNWNNVSTSGEYIKSKLAEPNTFVACTDTTPYYEAPVEETEEVKDTTSVKEVDGAANVVLYPNPSDDGSFSIKSPFEVEKVAVLDLSGRELEVFEKSNTIYITHNLMKGVYLVKVYGSKFVTVKRFVKN